ncbi:MAG: penicillin acylase family protein [Pseudomonadota bacterium]
MKDRDTRHMARIFKILYGLVAAMFGLILIAALLTYYFAARSIPDYDADYRISGIMGEVEVVRDNKAVPHIFAAEDTDVFFGLGFAHAQDRLWQMTLARRTAAGRLSELFGAETLDLDIFMRGLDLYPLSRRALAAQTPEALAMLEAYARGVNAWIRVVQRDALGRGAPEFFLFEPQIEPWAPIDSIALLKLLAIQSTDQIEAEILQTRSLIEIGPDLTSDIFPNDPSKAQIALNAFASLRPSTETDTKLALRHRLNPLPDIGFQSASNIWAAMPERTAAKSSLMAADPHVALVAPAKFYLAHLELASGPIIGATLPGLPIMVSGRSNHIAWGVSGTNADSADLYLEELSGPNLDRYRTDTGTTPLRAEERIIKIHDAPAQTHLFQWAGDRPLLPESLPGLAGITPRNHRISLAHTGLSGTDSSISAWLELMRARDVISALSKTNGFIAPSYNLLITDPDTIALQVIGALPQRHENHQGQGKIPAQSWVRDNQWQGMRPATDLPKVINPASGIIANTNNKLVDAAFPDHIAHEWSGTYRMLRLNQLLNGRRIHTRESFQEAQLDDISFAARTILAQIAKELWFTTDAAETGSAEAVKAEALDLLANWNGEMSEHTPEPLLFTAWLTHLQRLLIQDELGPFSQHFRAPNPAFIERVFKDVDGASEWCDIRPSTKVETCVETAERALEAALIDLSETYGDRLTSWRWGDAHQAIHKHEILGDTPFLSWVVNIQQSSSGGDHTLNRGKMSYTGETPYSNINAAGFRLLVDFADPESSLYILSTGQSGHPLSRHYDDLATLWRRGEYIPMSLDPEIARAGAIGTTWLRPDTEN